MRHRITNILIFFLFLLITPLNIIGKTLKEIFNEGNYFYRDGKFEDALKKYKEIYEVYKIKNAELFYNIGNCYASMGKYGYAVFYYMKAIKHNPQTLTLKRAEENLQKIDAKLMQREEKKERKILNNESFGLFHKITHIAETNTAFYLFTLCYILFFLVLILFRTLFSATFKKISLITMPFLFILTVFLGVVSFGKVYLDWKYDEGIVVEENVKMFEEKDPKSPFTLLPEALVVRILKNNNPPENYIHIELSDKKRGYVERGGVLVVSE